MDNLDVVSTPQQQERKLCSHPVVMMDEASHSWECPTCGSRSPIVSKAVSR